VKNRLVRFAVQETAFKHGFEQILALPGRTAEELVIRAPVLLVAVGCADHPGDPFSAHAQQAGEQEPYGALFGALLREGVDFRTDSEVCVEQFHGGVSFVSVSCSRNRRCKG